MPSQRDRNNYESFKTNGNQDILAIDQDEFMYKQPQSRGDSRKFPSIHIQEEYETSSRRKNEKSVKLPPMGGNENMAKLFAGMG